MTNIERYECGTCGRHMWLEENETVDYMKVQFTKVQGCRGLVVKCAFCKQTMFRIGGVDRIME